MSATHVIIVCGYNDGGTREALSTVHHRYGYGWTAICIMHALQHPRNVIIRTSRTAKSATSAISSIVEIMGKMTRMMEIRDDVLM
jgi:hypothetical protein